MSNSVLILKLLRTIIASEYSIIKRLLNESVKFIVQSKLNTTPWTSVIALVLPISDAFATTELVAARALLGFVNHHQANHARKVLVNRRLSTLSTNLSIYLHIVLNLCS